MKRKKGYGTSKERELRDILRAEGYTIVRSGASLERWDIVAIRFNPDGHSLWLQVKAGSAKYLKSCLSKWEKDLRQMPTCHHEFMVCYERGKGWWPVIDLPFLLNKGRRQK
jgi:hypothetical protein